MMLTHYTIVTQEMVWQWYYDEMGDKHVRELLGKQAAAFIQERDFVYPVSLDSVDVVQEKENIRNPE
jgi:hypothetical protein